MRYRALTTMLSAFVTLLIFIIISSFSCKKNTEPPPPDPCATVLCENGGTCKDGVCICKPGYMGDHCDGIWQAKYEGRWLIYDSSADGSLNFFIQVKPSKIMTEILIDSFWKYDVNNIIVDLADENTLVFEEKQNVYPGYKENYVLTKGSAKMEDPNSIFGTYHIAHDSDAAIMHKFTMRRWLQ